eukprot:1741083-Heterocapsa_arctica.AAC.1
MEEPNTGYGVGEPCARQASADRRAAMAAPSAAASASAPSTDEQHAALAALLANLNHTFIHCQTWSAPLNSEETEHRFNDLTRHVENSAGLLLPHMTVRLESGWTATD